MRMCKSQHIVQRVVYGYARGGGKKKKKANKVTMFDAKDIIDDMKLVESNESLEVVLAEMKLLLDQTIKIVKRPHHKMGMISLISTLS